MSGIIKTAILCILVGILFILPGCSDSGRHNPIYDQFQSPPIVTGMVFTDGMGNALGAWGAPISSPAAYPNPFCEFLVISLSLPSAGTFRVWVVKAYGPGESYDPLVSSAGGDAVVPYGAPLRSFNGASEAGIIQIVWDGADDAGNPLPSGFYRIYATAPNLIRWYDVFLARECTDIPVYLNAPKCE